jgi:hypothetical protein
VQAGARGAGFRCGLAGGTIGIDAAAQKLFVPNTIASTPDEAGIGFFALDEDGLPDDSQEDPAAPPKRKPPKAAGKLDRGATATRKVLTLRRQGTHRHYPTGEGWFAGIDATVMGGYSGCMIIDFNQGVLRQSWFNLPELAGHTCVAGHPRQPALYLALQDHNRLFQIAHADGYPSLLPQVATITGAHMIGIPVVLAQHSRLAIGDTKFLHLIGLHPDGRLDGKSEKLAMSAAQLKGLAYSEKHGRLYVAVDKAD